MTKDRRLKVSVIIPTLNEENYLPKLFECLDIEKETVDLEVIIADAFSKDRTREIARSYGAKVVDGGLAGFGRNQGAKVATSDVLFFIDADVYYKSPIISKCIDLMKSRGLDLANCRFTTQEALLPAITYWGWNILQPICLKLGFNMASGGVMIISKKLFNQVGGFDPSLASSEDFELAGRVIKSGHKFGILPVYVSPSTRRIRGLSYFKVFSGYISSTFSVLGQNKEGNNT